MDELETHSNDEFSDFEPETPAPPQSLPLTGPSESAAHAVAGKPPLPPAQLRNLESSSVDTLDGRDSLVSVDMRALPVDTEEHESSAWASGKLRSRLEMQRDSLDEPSSSIARGLFALRDNQSDTGALSQQSRSRATPTLSVLSRDSLQSLLLNPVDSLDPLPTDARSSEDHIAPYPQPPRPAATLPQARVLSQVEELLARLPADALAEALWPEDREAQLLEENAFMRRELARITPLLQTNRVECDEIGGRLREIQQQLEALNANSLQVRAFL